MCVCVVIQPIINQTASYTVTVAFFCDVEDESPGLSFLWERLVGSAVVDLNDTRITGIDTDRLQIGNVGRNDAGVYRCTISNDDSGIVDSEDTILIAEGIYMCGIDYAYRQSFYNTCKWSYMYNHVSDVKFGILH